MITIEKMCFPMERGVCLGVKCQGIQARRSDDEEGARRTSAGGQRILLHSLAHASICSPMPHCAVRGVAARVTPHLFRDCRVSQITKQTKVRFPRGTGHLTLNHVAPAAGPSSSRLLLFGSAQTLRLTRCANTSLAYPPHVHNANSPSLTSAVVWYDGASTSKRRWQ